MYKTFTLFALAERQASHKTFQYSRTKCQSELISKFAYIFTIQAFFFIFFCDSIFFGASCYISLNCCCCCSDVKSFCMVQEAEIKSDNDKHSEGPVNPEMGHSSIHIQSTVRWIDIYVYIYSLICRTISKV